MRVTIVPHRSGLLRAFHVGQRRAWRGSLLRKYGKQCAVVKKAKIVGVASSEVERRERRRQPGCEYKNLRTAAEQGWRARIYGIQLPMPASIASAGIVFHALCVRKEK
jgi:hypothetical protein